MVVTVAYGISLGIYFFEEWAGDKKLRQISLGSCLWALLPVSPPPLKYAWEKKQIVRWNGGVHFHWEQERLAGEAGGRGAPIGAGGGAGLDNK